MITRFLPSAFQYPFIHIPAQISIFYPIHQSLVVDLSAQLIEEADIQVKPFPVGIRTKEPDTFGSVSPHTTLLAALQSYVRLPFKS